MPATSILLVIILFVIIIVAAILIIRKGREKGNTLLLLQSQIDAMRSQIQQSLDMGNQNLNQQMSNVTKIFMDTIGQINSQLTEQMKSVSESVSNRLKDNVNIIQHTQHAVSERLDNASRIFSDLKGKIGEIEESNKQIFQLGKDLTQLQNLLKAPKFRGGLAEFMLSELLEQILPSDFYSLQYNLRSGRVDAVIKLGNGLIPVDAKFPMEGFNRIALAENDDSLKSAKRQFRASVKKHIEDIAYKYILPGEGTFDFALMYIPAENVYYEVILKEDKDDKPILDYALEKKVIPVSPNSFYAYLQTILLGLKGMKIEKKAQTVIRNLQQLQGDFNKFENEFQILGGHINRAYTRYRDLDGSLFKFGDRISRISADSSDTEPIDSENKEK
ncbi:DNA recombination protein RmuC [bacterium BMS3Abin07]|nr:DNA recombination protein RmuC [bacterium BMS3Abin07]GBE33103.1 DNA recombination protein RmuC [bacterium BMS3Bbin05]HDO21799.1 DNA recombination protein RmuC [Nitrospirota bacterium]HDZ88773.1 DNA recombination protein RmuC [Nitrospirota bacterium]